MATQGQQTELNLGKFSGVDASGSAESFLAELDRRDRLPQAVAFRKRLYELLQASPGDRVADVGCGTGKVVAELMECGVTQSGSTSASRRSYVREAAFPQETFASRLPVRSHLRPVN
jgi:SAM-dependent methyltransferase